jgi:hypothetical protein
VPSAWVIRPERSHEVADEHERESGAPLRGAGLGRPCAASAVVISALTSACDGTLPLITSLPSMARAGVDITP